MKKLIDAFGEKQLYLVGGSVRSMFTGEKRTDTDMATDALPEEMIAIGVRNKIPFYTTVNALKHGTVTFQVDGQNIEVTTFCKDVSCDGRNATVEFAKTIEEDLARRDLAINAMAINVKTREFIDLFGGKEDIQRRRIRAVGNPVHRLNEDTLRMLRAIRFANKLHYDIDLPLLHAIKCADISNLSCERVRDEFVKILETKDSKYIYYYICKVIPEFEEIMMDGGDHHNEMVDTHCILALHHMGKHTDNPYEMLAALCHDIGKGRAWKSDGSFLKHDMVGAEMMKIIMERLRFSIEQRELVCTLIAKHMSFRSITNPDASKRTLRRLLSQMGENTEAMLKLMWADNKANTLKEYPEWENSPEKRMLEKIAILREEEKLPTVKNLAINGEDLKALGFVPGPIFTVILNDCLEQVISDMPNTSEMLIEHVRATYL